MTTEKLPIYVIGYPKSGNTWLSRLLAELTNSKIDATNPVDDVDNICKRDGNYLICKLHDTGEIALPENSRIVYIVRDVRDMLVSAFFFNNGFIRDEWVRLSGRKSAIRFLSQIYFRHQIRRMNKSWCGNGLAELINLIEGNKKKIGNWSSHISSWSGRPGIAVVKYEDLLTNTKAELVRITRVMGIEVEEMHLQKVISNQSFEKKKTKFAISGDEQNLRFLRSGKAGEWGNYLSPEIVDEIEKLHASEMERLEYL